jgi:hypothetical protein
METEDYIIAIVDEYFVMQKRTPISRHIQIISLDGDAKISRRSIKYIVDSRRDDGYWIERMRRMFKRILVAMRRPDVDFPNPTQKYPDSRIALRRYPCEREALIVVYNPNRRQFPHRSPGFLWRLQCRLSAIKRKIKKPTWLKNNKSSIGVKFLLIFI